MEQPISHIRKNGKWIINPEYSKYHYQKYKEYYGKYRRTHKKQIRKRNQDHYRKNKAKMLKQNAEYIRKAREKLKNEIFKLLGNQCTHCKIKDKQVLQIDHVYGGGNKERKAIGNPISYYKKILEKIKFGSQDYQLLCANCNIIKRIERKEYRGKSLRV